MPMEHATVLAFNVTTFEDVANINFSLACAPKVRPEVSG